LTDNSPRGPDAWAWASRTDIVAQVQRLWDRGLLLAEVAGEVPGGPSMFPYRLRLRRPTNADLLGRYDDVRKWIGELSAIDEIRMEWRSAGSRTVGRNDVPSQAWIDTVDAAAQIIDVSVDVARFRLLVAATTDRVPALGHWVMSHGLEALAVADRWSHLLDVVAWIVNHPEPGIYVRQLDLPDVNTKFVETNRVVLGSMLDAILPTEAFDGEFSATAAFARRYRFRVPPSTVTFRSLDPTNPVGLGDAAPLSVGDRAITTTIDDFARLTGVRRVFITENFINFLAFPAAPGAIVVFGQGNDVGKLARAPWLFDVPVQYWGDIDTWGFAILDQLRSVVPHVRSLLMDHETLLRHSAQWVTENPTRRDLGHLSPAEQALYDDLRDNRLGTCIRLEQELIDYAWVKRAVRAGL
jgi:hypothetical protein